MSDSSRVQRAVASLAHKRTERYRDFLMHAGSCPSCGTNRCVTGEELWQAYLNAGGGK